MFLARHLWTKHVVCNFSKQNISLPSIHQPLQLPQHSTLRGVQDEEKRDTGFR